MKSSQNMEDLMSDLLTWRILPDKVKEDPKKHKKKGESHSFGSFKGEAGKSLVLSFDSQEARIRWSCWLMSLYHEHLVWFVSM